MNKTWKPTTAGILMIIGGCIGIGVAGCVGCIGVGLGTAGFGFDAMLPGIGLPLAALGAALIGVAVALVVLAIIGGTSALARKRWGLALTGAICACFPVIPLGVLAIIFVAMGKDEFE
ncbi:MAG: hypothetical protein JW790_02990 [Dehalococcoidales bacterium]|jgi:hypothetical protein|nr:hypothetical protein [Dehalococcoidales bacterium]